MSCVKNKLSYILMANMVCISSGLTAAAIPPYEALAYEISPESHSDKNRRLCTQLCSAIEKRDCVQVHELLSKITDPNISVLQGIPFSIACKELGVKDPQELAKQETIIQMLYRAGADDCTLSFDNLSEEAAEAIYSIDKIMTNDESIARTFLTEESVMPTLILPKQLIAMVKVYVGDTHNTYTHPLKQREIAAIVDKDSYLQEACNTGNIKQVFHALYVGANIESKNGDGNTPLQLAADNRQSEIVKLLSHNGANVRTKAQNGVTPLYLTITFGPSDGAHLDTLKSLLQHEAHVTDDPFSNASYCLHNAVRLNKIKVIQLLLDSKIDVETTNQNNETPLMVAVQWSKEITVLALLKNGANIHIRDEYGMMPLHLASKHASPAEVRTLLGHGASIDATDHNGRTPLHYAAERSTPDITRLLLDRGAATSVLDNNGETPMHIAKRLGNNQIKRMLLAKKMLPGFLHKRIPAILK